MTDQRVTGVLFISILALPWDDTAWTCDISRVMTYSFSARILQVGTEKSWQPMCPVVLSTSHPWLVAVLEQGNIPRMRWVTFGMIGDRNRRGKHPPMITNGGKFNDGFDPSPFCGSSLVTLGVHSTLNSNNLQCWQRANMWAFVQGHRSSPMQNWECIANTAIPTWFHKPLKNGVWMPWHSVWKLGWTGPF